MSKPVQNQELKSALEIIAAQPSATLHGYVIPKLRVIWSVNDSKVDYAHIIEVETPIEGGNLIARLMQFNCYLCNAGVASKSAGHCGLEMQTPAGEWIEWVGSDGKPIDDLMPYYFTKNGGQLQ